ncbi:NTP transferase domain-containing protein [Halorarius litoreus]|uniref:NTP transferase domain-containing protein n=1 Tax=Halorarius litoreus TaxID=2962676 RepID=UPI0020CB7200|nr:NTP transferase domain-containing protein [Halorarius litoreus]
MCGGQGTRLDTDVEKPLVEVAGVPMVDRVREALAASRIDTTYAVVSPHGPETHAHLADDLPCIETPGDGYVADLQVALDRVDAPVLTVVADLPLLEGDAVDRVLEEVDGPTAVVVPRALKTALGASVDYEERWVATGLNVVGDDEYGHLRSWDARLAVNVNRKQDVAAAERLLDDGA